MGLPQVSAGLFWESDSEDSADSGPWEWDCCASPMRAEQEGPVTPPLAALQPQHHDHLPEADEEIRPAMSKIFDSILMTLGRSPMDNADPAHKVHLPSKLPWKDVVDYHIDAATIRAKLDLSVYPTVKAFEGDVVMMLMNAIVLCPPGAGQEVSQEQLKARSILPRIAGYLREHARERGCDQPTVCSVRFSGKQPQPVPSEQTPPAAPAYRRILQKFLLLDHEQLFRDATSATGSTLAAPSSLSDVQESLQKGVYPSDYDFELDLRCLFLNIMASCAGPAQKEWKEARRLLHLVPQCLEEAGIVPCCLPIHPLAIPPSLALPPDVEKRCKEAIDLFAEADISGSFRCPVERDPRYRKEIRRPMDLTTASLKLHLGLYLSPQALRDDLRLILANCKLYHKRGGTNTPLAAALAMEQQLPDILRKTGLL